MCNLTNNVLPTQGNQGIIYLKAGMKRALETTDDDQYYEQLSPLKKMLRKSQQLTKIDQVEEIPNRASVIVNSYLTNQQHQLQQQENLAVAEQNLELQQLILQRLNHVITIQQQHARALKFILHHLNGILEMPNISSVSCSTSAAYAFEDFSLPETMKTIAELDNFEQRLCSNNKYREKAIQILTRIGNQDMKQSVRLMVDRLVHDNLACQFSFSGKRGKFTFSVYTGIIGVLLETCNRQAAANGHAGQVNPLDLKDYLVECLKNASDRVLKRQKRSCPKFFQQTSLPAEEINFTHG